MPRDYEILRAELYEAILAEFNPNDLQIIFDNHINSNPEIIGNHSYWHVSNPNRDWAVQCSDVLTHAYQNDLVPYLVLELQNARPNTNILAKLFSESGIGIFQQSTQALSLQSFIRDSNFQDPYVFVSKILRATRRTCLLIGSHNKLGTGFLVGDDKILTNHHVYEKAISSGESLSDIKAVFGYSKASDGRTVQPGMERKMDTQFEPIFSPISTGEMLEEEPNNLDYTYLKLETAIGEEQISNSVGVDEARGYFNMPDEAIDLGGEEDVFVFHHPQGGPVKCSPGQFESYAAESSRVRYDAPTLHGSSGGAVVNANFDLVALHHASDGVDPPQFNQGIPIHLIKKDIEIQLEGRG